MTRTALVAGIAVPFVLVAASAASAATWSFQGTAALAGASTWGLNGVSCLPDSACVAGGSYTDSSGFNHVLAEERVGSTWSVLSAAELEGTTQSEFNAVSCPSGTNCTLVGDYDNGTSQLPLAENFDGTDYLAIDVFPVPSGAQTTELTGISCASTSSCIAVGYYADVSDGSDDTAFAAALTGSTWSLLNVPVPSGSVGSTLSGVSCLSADSCEAVGYYSEGNGPLNLAESWNGSSWTVQSTPASADSELGGVSCTAANACTAVGTAVALRWNGTTWSAQTLAKPHPGTVPDLASVACTSGQTCTAVGTTYIEGVANPVAESWNGHSWKAQPINIETSFDTAYLSGVSCQPLVDCTAVGTYQDPVDGYRSFAETIDVQWQVQSTPVPSGAVVSHINAVSCPSATVCVAVADYIASKPGLHDFSEIWNGTGWTDGTIPNPAVTDLRAVSCPSATACMAVGDDTSNNSVQPLAAQWNGTTWTERDLPLPAGESIALLNSVSCPTTTFCVAVGTANNAAQQADVFCEVWNGSAWTVHVITAAAGRGISGVSCLSSSSCIAVGSGPSSSLAAQWNGTAWTILTTADPAGSTDATLDSVSCTPAHRCVAVGSYNNASHQVALAEVWNGTDWTLHRPPPLTGTKASELVSVSCSQTNACTAVGDDTATGQSNTSLLSERWDGARWMPQPVSLPSGDQSGNLAGVSCPGVLDCTAVGTSSSAALAELFS
ncbi:MAG TPA: hypothetical protein VGH27_28075 [Streptosporangiaceae bacterium]